MARSNMKLKTALDRYKGKDPVIERQKRLRKQGEKRKRARDAKQEKAQEGYGVRGVSEEAVLADAQQVNGMGENVDVEEDGFVSDEEEDEEEASGFPLAKLDESDSDSDDDEDDPMIEDDPKPTQREKITQKPIANVEPANEQSDVESDIPLSDIDVDEDADIIPHQRLTINNTTALNKALSSIALPISSMTFSEHQSITSPAPVIIPDVEDDLNRELAFYKQSISAVIEARKALTKEGVLFTRPPDYFAEMVKSDEHMDKIKRKLVGDAANKKAATDARRQRDLKKFGKQVQQEKLKERAKTKRDMLEKVKVLKRKRQGEGLGADDREEDMFDVALEDEVADRRGRDKARRKDGPPGAKRAKKDAKFGYGGKKKFVKSNDAVSAGDMSSYKRPRKQVAAKRPGKSRRAKMQR